MSKSRKRTSSSKRSSASQKRPSAASSTRKSSSNKKRTSSAGKKGTPANNQRLWWILGVVGIVVVLVVVLTLVLNQGKSASPDTTTSEAAVPETTAVVETSSSANPDMPTNPASRNGMYSAAPVMTIDPTKKYIATIVTEKGNIVVELYADKAPLTVNNFVFLAREGFYDNTTFHRVIEGFMAQAGDPTGTGMGGPGYQFADEFDADLTFDGIGILAMANAGANTNGSQFFITFAATPWLNGQHTIFGKVIEGTDVLLSISMRDPQTATAPGDLIKTIRIEEQ